MATQLIASHHAAMEWYRRAMLSEQTFEARRENLAEANKLSRSLVLLVEALNRHRGKRASRRSRSSTSMYMPGARRLSETWAPRGVGIAQKNRIKLMQSKLPMHLSPRCGARTRSSGKPCQSPCDEEWPMPDARRQVARSAKGNRNALRHGLYTADAIARRQELSKAVRMMKGLASLVNQEELS
jgi:hypothetical protein